MLCSSAARSARKLIVAVTVSLALLALAGGPAAAADGGFASVARNFSLSGDRDAVSAVVRVNRAAAGSGLALAVTLGKDSGVVTIVLKQDGGRAGSRGVQVDGFSMDFKDVQGCDYEMRLYCERAGYDWVAGRAYKISVVRGGRNGQGWLWTARIKDLKTGKTTKLVSLRSPASALTAGSVSLYTNPTDCADIAPVAGVVKKPRGAGSTVAWGKAENYGSCEGATLRAPIVRGAARLSIS